VTSLGTSDLGALTGALLLAMAAAGAVGYSIGDNFGTPCWQTRSNEEIVAEMLNIEPADVRPVSADMQGDWVRIVYAARFREGKCTMLIGNGTITSCENK